MHQIEHTPITFWAIATRHGAEKISNRQIYLDPDEAQKVCNGMNEDWRSAAHLKPEQSRAEPYKVYLINGLMTGVQELQAVDQAIEESYFLTEVVAANNSCKESLVSDVFSKLAIDKGQFGNLRRSLSRIREFMFPTHQNKTISQLLDFLMELKNPILKLGRLENEAKAALNQRLAEEKRPYPRGAIIKYDDMVAELLQDHGSSVIVLYEGDQIQWFWNYDGVECELISLPQ